MLSFSSYELMGVCSMWRSTILFIKMRHKAVLNNTTWEYLFSLGLLQANIFNLLCTCNCIKQLCSFSSPLTTVFFFPKIASSICCLLIFCVTFFFSFVRVEHDKR